MRDPNGMSEPRHLRAPSEPIEPRRQREPWNGSEPVSVSAPKLGSVAIITKSTNKGERAIGTESNTLNERSWFDVWQSKRIASGVNRRKFQLQKTIKEVSQGFRENHGLRASQYR